MPQIHSSGYTIKVGSILSSLATRQLDRLLGRRASMVSVIWQWLEARCGGNYGS